MPKLQDKTAVVTGASSGIGRAIALLFAREGARVVVNYRQSKDKASDVVDQIASGGGEAIAIQGDVSRPGAIESLIKDSLRAYEEIDIWVNNAGMDILTGEGAKMSDREKLSSLIEVDLKGTIHACWSLVPVMSSQDNGGVIVNMSWDMAIHGFSGRNPQMFAAVKAGVLGFTRAFAKTCGPVVRANVLAPGWIHTAFADEVMNEDYYDERVSEIPLGRFGGPDDVAESALFLASDESSYITGEMLKVNGGLS